MEKLNILITGAASGIGRSVAQALKENNIIALDICDIKEEYYKKYKVDVTNEEQLKNIFNDLSNENIKLDAIINIAGIFTIDSFIEVDNKLLKKMFDVNVIAPMIINKTFFSLLNPNSRIIITTSEVAPLDPMPFNGIYSTTKTSLDCYSQALRQELNLLGHKVITIRPGAIKTPLSAGSLEKTKVLQENTVLYKKQSGKFYNLVRKFMGTPIEPEKLAKLYVKAINKKHPKYIYKKHLSFGLLLLNMLPIRMQCWIIKLLLK